MFRGNLELEMAFRDVLTDLTALTALVNELRTDHATFKTVVDDTKTLANANRSTIAALLAKMDTDFADVANASVNYVSVLGASGSDGAKLGAAVSTSTPAAPSAGAVTLLTE